MSEPVSALEGVEVTQGLVSMAELGPCGMLSLRGDLSDEKVNAALEASLGLAVPAQRQVTSNGQNAVAWMSPDELLLMCPYQEAKAALLGVQDSLQGLHALVVNVSDARVVFELTGAHVRDVVAKLAPVDMHPECFVPGMFRRSRFSQIPAAFWMQEQDMLRVICFRSVARYMFDLLKMAAQPGSEVRFH
ncbi:MAG: sarcosine oxidase subunit gamma family protein [Pseudomonadota bacterium]